MTTPEGYSAGPDMCRIFLEFWERQEVVTRENGYHGPRFQATRGITQGYHILPTLFNIVVNNLVRNCMSITVEDEVVAHYGLVLAVWICMGMFYADDGLVGSRFRSGFKDPPCAHWPL